MNSDSAFIIGDGHQVCEDYAIDHKDIIILCDGCSSSQNTDIGSRLLALTALNILLTNNNFSKKLFKFIIMKLLKLKKNLPIFYETMFDSTLLIGKYLNDKNICKVLVAGDGIIVAKNKKGFLEIRKINFLSGYPYYLSYELNKERKEEFKKNNDEVHINYSYYCEILKKYDYMNLYYKEQNDFEFLFNAEEFEWVGLFSDGIETFKDEKGNEIDYKDIINKLTNFKTFTGQFVKRRINRFKKECIKNNWTHFDDISMAIIYLGE